MSIYRSNGFHPSLALAVSSRSKSPAWFSTVTLRKAELLSAFSDALALFCRYNQTEDGAGQDQLSYAHASTAEDFREIIYSC